MKNSRNEKRSQHPNVETQASLKWEKGYKNVEVFSKEHLAVSLAYDVAQLSTKFTKERGAFTVALSGGSLIKYLRKLVDSPYAETIDWSKWHVFWVDERVVPKDNLESNYKLANDGFLSKVPIPPLNVYSIDDSLPPDGAADVYETTLRRLVTSNVIATSTNGLPKFDLMLLERITFTFPVINASSNVAMVVTIKFTTSSKDGRRGRALEQNVPYSSDLLALRPSIQRSQEQTPTSKDLLALQPSIQRLA
ncbi:hypothetical protein KIW84_042710 [Lathyrus oleraceus]|uniref:Glucosamine/galactosamine-6-phosphate isomerase domain-containing protein n=1 Tax=Pisum sativum TaxID=3888 RepID=A0A9D5AQV3_PEA|nr:hypothetical protein KIW84_042710 [Pisum sativum]